MLVKDATNTIDENGNAIESGRGLCRSVDDVRPKGSEAIETDAWRREWLHQRIACGKGTERTFNGAFGTAVEDKDCQMRLARRDLATSCTLLSSDDRGLDALHRIVQLRVWQWQCDKVCRSAH